MPPMPGVLSKANTAPPSRRLTAKSNPVDGARSSGSGFAARAKAPAAPLVRSLKRMIPESEEDDDAFEQLHRLGSVKLNSL